MGAAHERSANGPARTNQSPIRNGMARRGSAPLMRARLAFAKETAFVTIFEERSVEHMPTSGHYRDTKRRGRPGDSGSEGCEAA
ncbi:hypothetical protein C4900_01305 [Acidiferrobacter thiooxydans]|uniref:Uncharacterized protein n=1 Tax=Acidiferrobacter thiooxydans TaxID=163359 RepID=A0A1C2FXE6_9GAMM|nr:hypothetical protein C4900_01305 [Acidiferrobacter thiooxydans]